MVVCPRLRSDTLRNRCYLNWAIFGKFLKPVQIGLSGATSRFRAVLELALDSLGLSRNTLMVPVGRNSLVWLGSRSEGERRERKYLERHKVPQPNEFYER